MAPHLFPNKAHNECTSRYNNQHQLSSVYQLQVTGFDASVEVVANLELRLAQIVLLNDVHI